ncbi:MAG: hypothetical protein ACE14M_01215 [Terriglobales bacterium]
MAKRHSALRDAGYTVVSAVNPLHAFKLLDARKFDALIVGYVAERDLHRLQQAARKCGMPVLWLCCSPNGNASSCELSCEDAVLQPAELVRKLELLLRSDTA